MASLQLNWALDTVNLDGDTTTLTILALERGACPAHPDNKSTIKYKAWRDRIFNVTAEVDVLLKSQIMFWATLWSSKNQSIWELYGSTKLAFEEYLLIGLAIDVFPTNLLNREGRTR